LVPDLRGQVPNVLEFTDSRGSWVVQLAARRVRVAETRRMANLPACVPHQQRFQQRPCNTAHVDWLASSASSTLLGWQSGQYDAVSRDFPIQNVAVFNVNDNRLKKRIRSYSPTTLRETKQTQSIPLSETISSPILRICLEILAADRAVGWWHTHTTGSRYGGD
jgi:hypothetical protein